MILKHVLPGLVCTLLAVVPSIAQEKLTYDDHVKPIFRAKCFSCHNTNKKTSDLDLSTYSSLMQGGASGASIEPGDSENSYLFMLMAHDSEPFMPPNSERVPDEMLETVKKWINAGAPENSSSKVMLPKKPALAMIVDISADARPEGPPPVPDVLNLEPAVTTSTSTAVSAIATSPWAKLAAVAGQKQVILYNTETLEPEGILPFPEGQPRVLKFSRDGSLLLAGGGHGASKGLAVVWNVRTGERITTVGDELDEVLAADISSDQTMIALGGPQKIVRVYRIATGELAYEITKHTDWIYALEFSPDSVLLATADRNGGLHIWEAWTGRDYTTLNGHSQAITGLSWRIDSNVLASSSQDRSVRLWEMENGNQLKTWNAHGDGTMSVEFCRDGRLVTCGRDRKTILWDQSGKQLREFEAFGDLALRVSHCDETDRVIAGDWTGEVRVWNAADGARVGNLTSNPPTLAARIETVTAQLPPAEKALADATAAQVTAAEATAAQQAKITAAEATVADVSTRLSAAKAAAAEAQSQLEAATKNQSQLTTQVENLRKAIPELKVAAERTAAALDLVKTDAQLKGVAEKLANEVNVRTQELTTRETELATSTQAVAELQKKISDHNGQAASLEESLASAKAAHEKEVAALSPLQEKLAQQNAALQTAQQQVAQIRSEVERWNHYVALRDELAALASARKMKDERQIASLEVKAILDEKSQAIQSVAEQEKTAMATAAEASKQMNELTAAMKDTEQKKTAALSTLALQKQALPMVEMALTQSTAAAEILKGDSELEGLKQSLTETVNRMQTTITSIETQVAQLDQSMNEAQTQMSAAASKLAESEQQAKQSREMLTSLESEAAPLKEQLTAAEQELQAAEEKVQQAESIVEARRKLLRPSDQRSQASL